MRLWTRFYGTHTESCILMYLAGIVNKHFELYDNRAVEQELKAKNKMLFPGFTYCI